MTPTCSSCKRVIPSEDVNVSTDVAFCRLCNLAHKLSAAVHEQELGEVDLAKPPDGSWYHSTGLGSVAGATHRSWPAAFGTLAIALFWNGIVSVFVVLVLSSTLKLAGVEVPDWFPAPKMNGKAMTIGVTIFMWLFLTPFIVIGLAMIGAFFSAVGGRTEIRLRANEATIFTGIGAIGLNRRFKPELVKDVSIEDKSWRDSDGARRSKTHILIQLQDGKQIKCGSSLRADRMRFMAAAARQLLAPR